MTVDPSTLGSIAQAAKALPFSELAIRNRIARGELRTIKIADHVYLEEDELRRAFGDLYRLQPATK
jgi:hypothetical protein